MFKHPRPILIVDDDVELVTLLVDYLQLEGFAPVAAHNGTEALELLSRQEFEIVVLDVMMPGMSGVEVLKRIREKSQLPVLMLTAKGDPVDRIIGLELGADDYISKPFSLREVLARVKAVLRRTSQDEEAQDEEGVIRYQGLVLDDNRKEVWVDGEHVALTRIEYSLLLMMLENRGKILSRQQLINHVWPHDVIVLDRTVDVNITRLRRKVKAYAEHIVTRQGFGYGFEVKTN